jgi:hypothetical protein
VRKLEGRFGGLPGLFTFTVSTSNLFLKLELGFVLAPGVHLMGSKDLSRILTPLVPQLCFPWGACHLRCTHSIGAEGPQQLLTTREQPWAVEPLLFPQIKQKS